MFPTIFRISSFCVQNKHIHTGLDLLEDEYMMTHFSFLSLFKVLDEACDERDSCVCLTSALAVNLIVSLSLYMRSYATLLRTLTQSSRREAGHAE